VAGYIIPKCGLLQIVAVALSTSVCRADHPKNKLSNPTKSLLQARCVLSQAGWGFGSETNTLARYRERSLRSVRVRRLRSPAAERKLVESLGMT
jgi:hypothetical protein